MNRVTSKAELQGFADILIALRQRVCLSKKRLAERAGISLKQVDQMERGEQLPDEETKKKLEEVFSWPLYLPPRKVVTVRIGEWAKNFDERIAPLVQEMLLAGFPTWFCDVDGMAVMLTWPRSERLQDFLNIVVEHEDIRDPLYYRMHPEMETAGEGPKWSFALNVDDFSDDEGEESDFGPLFLVSVTVTFPIPDLPIVVERLKAHNQQRNVGFECTPSAPCDSGPKQCKVNLAVRDGPMECVWATRLSAETAMITNIPFLTNAVAFHDLVRVGPCGDLLEVLETVTRTRRATYDAVSDKKEASRQWQAIVDHFAKENIETESAVAGIFCMAVPVSMGEDRFLEACNKCPVPLKYPEGGEK